MPFAGYVSTQGELNYIGIVLAGTIGSVLGTIPFYFIGRKIGEKRLKRWVDEHGRWLMLSPDDIDRARSWFDRHDAAAVFLCRLVPGIRTLISIPAGIERMNFGTFLLLSLLGTGIWVGLLTYLGRALGEHYERVGNYLGPVSYVVIGGLILWYAWYVFSRRKKQGEE